MPINNEVRVLIQTWDANGKPRFVHLRRRIEPGESHMDALKILSKQGLELIKRIRKEQGRI